MTMQTKDKLLQAVWDAVPPEDRAVTEEEAAFLIAYRQADEAGKSRVRKLLQTAAKGLLPPPEVAGTWTREQVNAFADSLPEVTP